MDPLTFHSTLFICVTVGSVLAVLVIRRRAWARWIAAMGAFLLLGIAVRFFVLALALQLARARAEPVADQLRACVDGDGVVRQTSGVSCGPAAAANLLRRYGIEATEKELAGLMKTTERGTTFGNLVRGLSSFGFTCNVRRVECEALRTLQRPVILLVDHPQTGPESHVITYCGLTNGLLEALDPLQGRVLLSEEQLGALWRGTLIECVPTGGAERL